MRFAEFALTEAHVAHGFSPPSLASSLPASAGGHINPTGMHPVRGCSVCTYWSKAMSNCYYDRTGVLIFNGVPVLTPVVRALFGPFQLKAGAIGEVTDDKTANEIEIRECSVDTDVSWQAVALSIATYSTELGVELPDDATDWEIRAWLKVLAEKYNVVDGRTQKLLLADRGFDDGDADLETLLDLAMEFNDGHNLLAVKYEAAWNGDSDRLYGLGGAGAFYSPRVSLVLSSTDVRKAGQTIDAALWANDVQSAAGAVNGLIDIVLAGIKDEGTRRKIWEQMITMRG
ncbi:hypothetical protein [Paraburkholderia youngii]|uniref:hypothetical protein n=1 Tax=Paraburkholderia youngii TaxID=2782701 RepID=UPI003D260F33